MNQNNSDRREGEYTEQAVTAVATCSVLLVRGGLGSLSERRHSLP
jgi:hypothetical protein